MGKWALPTVLVVVAAGLVGFYKNSRFGVPSPDYRVLEKDGPFEVREYPPLVLVSTSMPSADVTEGSAFMRLFRYISGANEAEQKIRMTTPVLTEKVGGQRRMSFPVPEEVAGEGAPRPLASDVELAKLESGRFAAYRFSGSGSREEYDEALQKIREWARERGLDPTGEPIIAKYDPPFMPTFLRRNEVLVRLASSTDVPRGCSARLANSY